MKILIPQTGIWKCQKCGYQGSVVIEDGNIEKQLKETRKMEKLNRKLSWRR
jgi:ribosomal protein L37AE/L43A